MSTNLLPNGSGSTMANILLVFESMPQINPIYAAVIGVFLPLLLLFTESFFRSYEESDPIEHRKFIYKLSKNYWERPGVYLFFHLTVAIVLCWHQGLYIYRHLPYSTSFDYYLSVNLPIYDQTSSINLAAIETSYASIVGSNSPIVSNAITQQNLQFPRRLSMTSTLSLIYHKADYSNILTEDDLKNICQTQLNILTDITCLNNANGVSSLIPYLYNYPLCTQMIGNLSSLNQLEKELYLQDNFNGETSSILISYTETGSCDTLDPNKFHTMLNNVAVGDIEVTFSQGKLLNIEFFEAIYNVGYVSLQALVLSLAFYAFWMRGLLCCIMTVIAIVVSIIVSASLLPIVFHFSQFSTFNIISVFILLGMGGNTLLLFHSSWRMKIPVGQVFTPIQIVETYLMIGKPFLYTILTACISLFSKLISPVIVISQLGAFVGLAVIVFYFEFHYLILPTWILTSRVHLPQAINRWMNSIVTTFTCGWFAWTSDDSNIRINSSSLANSIIRTEAEISTHESLVLDPSLISLDASANTNTSFNGSTGSPTFRSSDIVTAKNLSVGDDFIPSVQLLGSDDFQHVVSPPSSWLSEKTRKIIYYIYRIVLFIGTLVCLYFVYILVNAKYVIDFGIPQLMPANSNLGQALEIIKIAKPSLFTLSPTTSTYNPIAPSIPIPSFLPSLSIPSVKPTNTPSSKPTSRAPTSIPTRSMTPSSSPSSHSPSSKPPPSSGSTSTISTSTTSFVVKTCWGISYSKTYIDETPNPIYDSTSFLAYIESDFLSDVKNYCNFVNMNRVALNIDPTWNESIDCLYDQLMDVVNGTIYNELMNAYAYGHYPVTSMLIVWGASTSTSASLLGVSTATNYYYPLAITPLWVCANFTGKSNVTSFLDNSQAAVDLMSLWNKDFLANANEYHDDISLIVGSSSFTLPILALEVLHSILLSLIISIVGFIGLLFVFTLNISISLLGTLSMISIVAVSILLHIHFFSITIDLLDVIVFIAIIGIIVDFPIHLISHFQLESYHHRIYQDFGLDYMSIFLRSRLMKSFDPVLSSISFYMRHALLGPTILAILMSLPLLLAQFQIVVKIGQYIMITTIVSYIIATIFLPAMLGLSFNIVSDCIIPLYKGFKSYCCCSSSNSRSVSITDIQVIANSPRPSLPSPSAPYETTEATYSSPRSSSSPNNSSFMYGDSQQYTLMEEVEEAIVRSPSRSRQEGESISIRVLGQAQQQTFDNNENMDQQFYRPEL